jgi:drug/metabolite transporter (DMT)-like permease
LVDGVMPFALGAAQCFAAYFAWHDVHSWYWSIAALCFIGCIGYVNAEVNARINRKENAHINGVLWSATADVTGVCSTDGCSLWRDRVLDQLVK